MIKLFKEVKGSHLIALSIILFALASAYLPVSYAVSIFSSERIYSGIYINEVHVGNYSQDDALELLQSEFSDNLSDVVITIDSGKTELSFPLTEIDYQYDLEKAVNKAVTMGKQGSIFKRIISLISIKKNNITIELNYSFNDDKLKNIINDLYKDVYLPVEQHKIVIDQDKLNVLSGVTGESINTTLTYELVKDAISTPESQTINIDIDTIHPGSFDIENLLKSITLEPVSAEYSVVDNEVIVSDHSYGRTVDKDSLDSFLKETKLEEGIERTLSLDMIEPEYTQEELESLLFRDVLGTMSTKFNTSTQNNKNRAVNIALSTNKIAGLVLGTGDRFSYNDVVGPRTAQAGYKAAHVYLTTGLADGIGGGICQVSSTLYNAAIYADMKIISRWNHYYTVGYVPFGTDATVSYNSTDFIFENSSKYPVRIDAEITDDNQLIFTIIGTNLNPGMEIELAPEIIKQIPFSTKYIDDEELLPGETKTVQNGMPGYIVNTYRIVKMYGDVTERTLLHVNYYNPLSKIVKRGIEPELESETETEPETENNPEPVVVNENDIID